jgi:hypothetical protein
MEMLIVVVEDGIDMYRMNEVERGQGGGGMNVRIEGVGGRL